MGRTVTALVTYGGACVGGVGPFDVDIPWWAEVEPVVAHLEEALGVPVVVLRLLTVEGVVVRNNLRPIPRDTGETEARRLSAGRFTTAVSLAGILAPERPVPRSRCRHQGKQCGRVRRAVIVGEMLLYRHVLPRRAMVAAATRRLEAEGALSYLSEELTGRPEPDDAVTPAP